MEIIIPKKHLLQRIKENIDFGIILKKRKTPAKTGVFQHPQLTMGFGGKSIDIYIDFYIAFSIIVA